MARLTKKANDNNYVVDTYISLNEPWKSLINKLGQLEDIEDELGVDLITLFKALKDGIWGTMYGRPKEQDEILFIEPRSFKLCIHTEEPPRFIYIWGWPGPDYNRYLLKDYGKTWALTREELQDE